MIFFVIVFLVLVFMLILRSIYLSDISAVKLNCSCDVTILPVKPSKKFFRSISSGHAMSFVKLGSGYIAFYVDEAPDLVTLGYNDVYFNSDVYIFKRGCFGRFQSVDLSDRCLSDILKKFKGVI